jgi:hypothetical protein
LCLSQLLSPLCLQTNLAAKQLIRFVGNKLDLSK